MYLIKSYKLLLIPIILLLFISCQEESEVFFPNKRIIKLGDDLAWASPEIDDSDWDQSGATLEVGQFWVRFNFDFDTRINKLNRKGVNMISLGSYEAYWDGELIHENGQIGTSREQEVEGQFISQILIPDSLCQVGSHVLALRLSNYHNKESDSWSWNTCIIEEYNFSLHRGLRVTGMMFILGGCFLIVSLYYFLLFFNSKENYAKLVFSFMCLLFFVLMVLEYLKFFYPYLYTFHNTRLVLIGVLTTIIAFVVPVFLCLHFKIRKIKLILGVIAFLLLMVAFTNEFRYDSTAILMSTVMLIASIAISAFAVYLKRKRSIIILLAFLAVALINYVSTFDLDFMLYNYDVNLFLSFLILVLAVLYVLSQQRREQQIAYETSLLLSERLKNELLKKNIQPHFIMNTLTSIMEWVERSPQKGIEFIDSLAGEFELLNDMADEKLVSVGQEIDLCKKHLEIMAYRKETKYQWTDDGVDRTKEIPPAVFHTIIENGITHSKTSEEGIVKFVLSEEEDAEATRYQIEVIAVNRKKSKSDKEGTGFKYIKSRLTESYGDRWDLKSEATTTGWLTEVSIMKR